MKPLCLAATNMWEGLWNSTRDFLPSLAAALGVLIVGVIVAYLIAAAVRWALSKTTVDERLSAFLRGGAAAPPRDSGLWISRIVFWFLMLIVLVAVFQVLALQAVVTPLNTLLNQVFAYLPRLVGAGVLLAVAWLLATGLRMLVVRGLGAMKLDQRIQGQMHESAGNGEPSASATAIAATPAMPLAGPNELAPAAKPAPSLARTLGDVVYWLVFLMFLPLVLDALNLQGLLGPVSGMINQILVALPNILAAVVILAVGYFLANIIRRIIASLLVAAGADRLTQGLGGSGQAAKLRLSALVAYVAFVLVLIPVVLAALNALNLSAVTRPAEDMLRKLLDAVPNIFAAAVLLALAWFIARLVASVVANVLAAAGFDTLLERMGLTQLRPRAAAAEIPATGAAPIVATTPSGVVGKAAMVAVLLMAAEEALGLLGFVGLSALAHQLLVFLGHVALGLIIIGVGAWLANLAAGLIHASRTLGADILATAARIAILVLVVAMGVEQMGIGNEVVKWTLLLLAAGAALAIGLAFGLGGQRVADGWLRRWTQRGTETGELVGK